MYSKDIASTKDTVAFSSIYDPNRNLFFQCQWAPDGKIYISHYNQLKALTVIENPNIRGDSCNVKQKGIPLPVFSVPAIPHHPNYRLGRVKSFPAFDAEVFPDYCDHNTGKIQIIPKGGTPPFQYIWSSGDTTSYLEKLRTNKYSVTVTDYEGCTEIMDTDVPSMQGPKLEVSSVAAHCGKADGIAFANGQGGFGTLSYKWSNGSTGQQLISNAGVYDVTVSDSLGCQVTQHIEINNLEGPKLEVSSVAAHCGKADGIAFANGQGGFGTLSYKWSDGSTGQQLISKTGVYDVTVTDSIGCQTTQHIEISDLEGPKLEVSSVAAHCGKADGIAFANGQGGFGALSYKWSDGSTGQQLISKAGVYDVTVTDSIGCQTTQHIEINDLEGPKLEVSSVAAHCGKTDGVAFANGHGGFGTLSYKWSDGSMGQQLISKAGLYEVTVTDSIGCQANQRIQINDLEGPKGVSSTRPAHCFRGDGMATIIGTGGYGTLSYKWSNGTIGDTIYGTSGVYSVSITDTIGCLTVVSIEIKEVTGPILLIKTKEAYCGRQDGIAYALASAGTGKLSYKWSTGESGISDSSSIKVKSGTYFVTISDSVGCKAISGVYVGEIKGPEVQYSLKTPDCNLKNGELMLFSTIGARPFNYIISTGEICTSDTCIIFVQKGIYNIQISDSNNCKDTILIDVDCKVGYGTLKDNNFELKSFPNPATDRLTIEVTLPHYEERTELVLCDITGKELIKTTLPDYAYIGYMDVSHLAAGIYIVQLRQRGRVLKSEKVVIAR